MALSQHFTWWNVEILEDENAAWQVSRPRIEHGTSHMSRAKRYTAYFDTSIHEVITGTYHVQGLSVTHNLQAFQYNRFKYKMYAFLFTTASRTALGPTQPPIQWVPGALSLGVKRPVREADHSPPSSAEVKNAWRYTSTPQYVFMEWRIVKHRDNFTFYHLFTLSGSGKRSVAEYCERVSDLRIL
jgi:hypothetical protein